MSLRCRTIPSPTFSSPPLRHFTGFRIFRPTMTDLRSFRVTAEATVSGSIWSGSGGRVEREYFIMKRRGLCVYGVGEDDLSVVEREGDPTVEDKEGEQRVMDEREDDRTMVEREGDPTIVVERENGWTVAEEEREGDRRVVEEREGDQAVVVEREYDRRVVVEREGDRRRGEVLVAASVTVVLGVANRVLYKLALVPLKHYPFFLAQLATFGYVLVYFSILYIRYRSGIVTEDMLSLPKGPYVVVGLLEALGAASGMAAGAILSGAAIPILSQSFLVWQILFSYIFLGRSYRFNQLFGCFMVALGVIITVASGSGAGSLMEAGVFWSLLMIVSFAFQAADTVLKEIIFLDSSRQLKGGTVDLFVINSYGSAFQALFICLLLPFLSKLWGIPFNQLPNYLRAGAGCFMNNGSISGCEGAPLLPLLFVIVNMGFNISLLYLLKISSAVVSCLASTVSVPISVLLFTLPLPYLGVASSLPSGFVAGAMVLFLGMLIYSWSPTSSSTAPKQSVD